MTGPLITLCAAMSSFENKKKSRKRQVTKFVFSHFLVSTDSDTQTALFVQFGCDRHVFSRWFHERCFLQYQSTVPTTDSKQNFPINGSNNVEILAVTECFDVQYSLGVTTAKIGYLQIAVHEI